MLRTPAMRLNRRYHCMLKSAIRIAASWAAAPTDGARRSANPLRVLGVRALESQGERMVALQGRMRAEDDAPADLRQPREPTKPLVRTRDPRDLTARGRLQPEALGPCSEGSPHEDVEGQHDRREHRDPDRDRRDVAVPARDGDERSEARALELRPARGEDFARDEEEPAVRPRERSEERRVGKE